MAKMLAVQVILSTALAFTFAYQAAAHEIRPAIADVSLSETQVEIEMSLTAETLLSGMDLQGLEDTNDAPEAELYDQLRALEPADLVAQFRDAWGEISGSITVLAGEAPVTLELGNVEADPVADPELPRDTRITLTGALPEDGSDLRMGWAAANGPLIVRQAGAGDDAYAGFLDGGALSEPLPRAGAATESAWSVFFRYIGVGFDHIIPKGLDHILFVLGLFFLSLKLRPLVMQVTVFTIAHTITLALASLQIVTVSPAIVEPLIALSIVYVAIENLFTTQIRWWRPLVIFAFGLLHGLGFASVLGEFGLAPGRFIAGLIGFNIGVEVGQLTVIALALILVWLAVQAAKVKKLDPLEEAVEEHEVMYQGIAIPGSIVIAIIGAYWAFERVFL